MKKIISLFQRNYDGDRKVRNEVTPGAEWVIAGEGVATRKFDGTCTMFDGERWWARREVKTGKSTPANFRQVESDDTTGKTMGWEPIEQSAFAKYHAEALFREYGIVDQYGIDGPQKNATYELIGPKVNGNPENAHAHMLVRHGYRAAADDAATFTLARTFDDIREWLLARNWEGIVWHHQDGRMVKIKRKDFA